MKWIEKKTIRTNVKVNSWQEAVQQSGDLLVAAELVETSYVNAMIETTQELGPYCVIAPGIAMPHARPETGVKNNGYAAITLSEPVEFGNPDNDPVFLVLAFCALDHDSHIESLKLMANAISQEGFSIRAKQAINEAELEKVLNSTN
ncbi:MAG: PTS sugar transporter subunit IIA [Anaerolineaceae bacterium]|nr:PTS sugar transporter subunit IIA [Anaerolineaceae bacterium]